MYELFTAYMRLLFYFFTAREQVVKARNFCTPPTKDGISTYFLGKLMW